jgi:hypothetical protein
MIFASLGSAAIFILRDVKKIFFLNIKNGLETKENHL